MVSGGPAGTGRRSNEVPACRGLGDHPMCVIRATRCTRRARGKRSNLHGAYWRPVQPSAVTGSSTSRAPWHDLGRVLTQLERYRVDQLLARGGMGEVYLGRIVGAHGFERPIVIKLIRTELVTDERVALMFVDEARIAAGLHHRNIVQTID